MAYEEYLDYVAVTSVSAARGYSNLISMDEAIQLGWVAFLEAKPRWNGDATLQTFTYRRIRGAIIDELREILRVSWVEFDEGFHTTEDRHDDGAIEFWLSTITNPRQKEVLSLCYSKDLSNKEISKVTGIGEPEVSSVRKRGIRVLQKQHCKTGW